jgi:SynChlorMet cassette protein ScmC
MASDNHNCYSLELANGESWSISGNLDATSWLERLANILELPNGAIEGRQRLTFVRDFRQTELRDLDLLNGSSGNGWKTERVGYINLHFRSGESHIICDLGEEEGQEQELNKMWNALYPIYRQALDTGGLPFHATLVELNGKGFAIAAPGGIGKSTCAKRIPYPWKSLSDDEMLVVRDVRGHYFAHPFPTWKEHLEYKSNRTWNVQYNIPLAGIFFLIQSDIDQVESIGKGKASTLIYRSASQVFFKSWLTTGPNGRDPVRVKTFQNACQMAEAVPSFFLKASISGRFWENMQEALKQSGSKP